jgi:hypothetical protein
MLIYTLFFSLIPKTKGSLAASNYLFTSAAAPSCFQGVFFKRKKTHYTLNKSGHVHKKAKEHFVFFWPNQFVYVSPVFFDLVSHNFFVSYFLKSFFLQHKSAQVSLQKNVIFYNN